MSDYVSPEDSQSRMVVIGMLVERFSLLEWQLRRTLWLLLHADPVAAHVLTTNTRGAGDLIRTSQAILKEAARKGKPRGTAALSEALTQADALVQRRNDLLHNPQLPGDGFHMTVWKYRRGQDSPTVIPAGLEEMTALWVDVNNGITAIVENAPKPPHEMPAPYI